ncbi:hypothetical protein B0T22DRAFT_533025 [Podospora appendiculata]|uniref:HMG box domain-containing protein n=1 Tax=Podospora appendiculata TaxID=314037 RepID=A0AAE0XJ11_9PEZI|nr:hypothetical protein B0T22DRAFT_533025 [Podospora appendiculata]
MFTAIGLSTARCLRLRVTGAVGVRNASRLAALAPSSRVASALVLRGLATTRALKTEANADAIANAGTAAAAAAAEEPAATPAKKPTKAAVAAEKAAEKAKKAKAAEKAKQVAAAEKAKKAAAAKKAMEVAAAKAKKAKEAAAEKSKKAKEAAAEKAQKAKEAAAEKAKRVAAVKKAKEAAAAARAQKAKEAEKAKKAKAKELAQKQKEKLAHNAARTKQASKSQELVGLKAAAMIASEPKKLPEQPWVLFISRKVHLLKGKWSREVMGGLVAEYKALPASDREEMIAICNQNKLTNKAALNAWVQSFAPIEIYKANAARKRLRNTYNVRISLLKDDRLPKHPLYPYIRFSIARYLQENAPAKVKEGGPAAVGAEWKALGPEERQPFIDEYERDRAQYVKDVRAVLGRSVRPRHPKHALNPPEESSGDE